MCLVFLIICSKDRIKYEYVQYLIFALRGPNVYVNARLPPYIDRL